jgi:putative endonuclease
MHYVYIATNRSKTLYTGIATSLERRMWEHKTQHYEGFTSRYRIDRLVYYQTFTNRMTAVTREKQIKGWGRVKKMALIVSMNPEQKDLSEEWFVKHRYAPDEPKEKA